MADGDNYSKEVELLGPEENLWDKFSDQERFAYLDVARECAQILANSLGASPEQNEIIEAGYVARFERLARTPRALVQKQVAKEEPVEFTPEEQREFQLVGELLQSKLAQSSVHQN